MTGIDRIKTKILDDAKEIAEENLNRARQEAERIIAEARGKAREEAGKARQAAKAEAANLKKTMDAVSSLEERKRMLKVRQDMVDAAFRAAFERTLKLPAEEYGSFIRRFILESVRDGEGEILFNEADRSRLGEKYVEEINRTLKAEGKTSVLRLSGHTIPNRGGFVLRYGEMEINCTLEIIFSLLRPRLEAEVASILFEA
ncbi:MAG: V-type ATP synthase subunit E [Clostridiaceae bacterium]|jgi:V/A-type H+-transporting ATPase subunit E|nr:V-type ATP synthase subunit E [Clostridiaceae bacterium]